MYTCTFKYDCIYICTYAHTYIPVVLERVGKHQSEVRLPRSSACILLWLELHPHRADAQHTCQKKPIFVERDSYKRLVYTKRGQSKRPTRGWVCTVASFIRTVLWGTMQMSKGTYICQKSPTKGPSVYAKWLIKETYSQVRVYCCDSTFMCIISLIWERYVGLLQCVAGSCIMLQCGVVCCSVLQVLQCVAVCCSARSSTVPRSHTLVKRDLYQLKETYRPTHSQDTFVRPWDLTIYTYIYKTYTIQKRPTQEIYSISYL